MTSASKLVRLSAQKSVDNWGKVMVGKSVGPMDEMSAGLLVGATARISDKELAVPMAWVMVEVRA